MDSVQFWACAINVEILNYVSRCLSLIRPKGDVKSQIELKKTFKSSCRGYKVLTICCCQGSLDKHIKIVHQKERPFRCNACGVSFGQKVHMDSHISAVHNQVNKLFQSRVCWALVEFLID